MALEIDTDLLNGLTAAYWKLVRWEIDTEIPRAYGEFKVYTDRNYAKIKRAASPLIAVVRLTGADFDGWFGSERDPKATDQAIFYAAAKELGVVSDFGPAPESSEKKIKPGHRSLFKAAKDLREDLKKPSKPTRGTKK